MGEQLRNESMALKKKSKTIVDENKLTSLMLYDNGLKDIGFAQIIEGISCLKTVNSLTYFGNEIGMESIDKLEELAWEEEKKALKDLRIGYLKTSSKCLLELFGLI